MDRVSFDLEHCYGIKALKYNFDFSATPAYAIYAPNGVMKSSLAETFQDAAKLKPSEDRIFPDRVASRHITDENGVEIEGERVLVVPSYDAGFLPTEKTSTLLVSAELRRESEQLEDKVTKAREALLSALKAQSGSKKDFAQEVSTAIMRRGNAFEAAVLRISREIERQTESPFAAVKYDMIFNDKVQKALEDKDLMADIKDYVDRYNDLLAKSNYFRRGTFDYYNAGQISKSLADNGFFNAQHTVTLYGGAGTVEVKTQKELQDIIDQEKQQILTDKELRKKFDAVAKKLEKNVELRDFCQYLQEDEAILSRMADIDAFREDVLKSYIKENEAVYNELISTIESVEKRRSVIAEEARKQTTQWDEVLRIFNERFYVPFELIATNKVAVMLGQDTIPMLGFRYKDGAEEIDVGRETLLRVLSTGERKALYIINVIFEIERRRKDGVETLVVVDDIADSFDYNNKYAIIQYLQDISEGAFKLIIMTHNFDFFRTIESRFVSYSNCLMASKNETGITLVKASGIRNVFANDWKKDFFANSRKKIASICFLRNIVEMTTGPDDRRYIDLTSMLHLKAASATLTVADLDTIFNSLCQTTGASANAAQSVVDLVLQEAAGCARDGGALRLENKIVLAMGIRIAAERFMIAKINDAAWVEAIKENQTRRLIVRFKRDFPGETQALGVLDRVELMTPENIHVNSFMYEPIIDMGDDHLRELFSDVSNLT